MFIGLDNPRTLLIYAAIIIVLVVAAVALRYRLRD